MIEGATWGIQGNMLAIVKLEVCCSNCIGRRVKISMLLLWGTFNSPYVELCT